MSEFQNTEDLIPTTVKNDLVNLDGVFDNTNEIRDTVLKKLSPIVEGMEISTDSPKLIEAQMGIINTYLSVLTGKETNISRRVASKLKLVETESVSKHSAAVADLLAKISAKSVFNNNDPSNIDQHLMDRQVESAFDNSGLPEILDTELKTDPKDLDH